MSVKNPVAKKIPGNFCFSGWHKVENEQGRKLKWGSLGCCYPEYGPAAWASPGMLARNLESQASLQTPLIPTLFEQYPNWLIYSPTFVKGIAGVCAEMTTGIKLGGWRSHRTQEEFFKSD